jgi:hypothetical protein
LRATTSSGLSSAARNLNEGIPCCLARIVIGDGGDDGDDGSSLAARSRGGVTAAIRGSR